jgi:hypothetical protein
MSSRVGGAVLALAAAALLAVPMASSALMDAGGWWSGHPSVTANGKTQEMQRKEVYVGFFSARGCNTGGEDDKGSKCEGLTKLLPTSYTITALVEAALTGLAAIMAIGLGVTILQGGEGRKVLAKLMLASLAIAAAGALALIIIGPSFKGMDVSVPFGPGFFMFVGANLFAGTASVLALRKPRPARVKVPKPAKPPKAVAVSPIPSLVQPPPQQPFDVQALFADDHLRPAALGPEPAIGRYSPPIAPGGALPGPSGPLVPPHPEPQPLFQSAPQHRPLYEVNAGEGFVPQAVPQVLPTRPPTPIPRAEINAAMGIPPPLDLVESQPPPRSKPTTMPPPRGKPTTIPPTPAADPFAVTAAAETAGPSAPTLFGTAPGPMATPPTFGASSSVMPAPATSPTLDAPPRPKPATLPPPKAPLGTSPNGPRPQVPMPPRTASATIPPPKPGVIGRATPSKSQPTLSPPVPAIPAPALFPPMARASTDPEERDSNDFETKTSAAQKVEAVVADRTDSAIEAFPAGEEGTSPSAPAAEEPVAAHAPIAPETGDDAETRARERQSARSLGLATPESTEPLPKDESAPAADPKPAEPEPEPEPPPAPEPPKIVPTLTSMARALRQKRAAERERERTATNIKAAPERTPAERAAARAEESAKQPAPKHPTAQVPITTASSSLPPPSAAQVATSGPSPACPQCEAPMAWVEEHLRFYCKACRMYF